MTDQPKRRGRPPKDSTVSLPGLTEPDLADSDVPDDDFLLIPPDAIIDDALIGYAGPVPAPTLNDVVDNLMAAAQQALSDCDHTGHAYLIDIVGRLVGVKDRLKFIPAGIVGEDLLNELKKVL